MASSGHRFIAHTKALSPRVGAANAAYGLPPHPLSARPGQRFWARTGKRKVAFAVRRVTATHAVVQREDDAAATSITLPRLIAVRADDDQGRWYQFLGYKPRRYRTLAQVVARDDRLAVLCLPEWHPRRPALLFARLLPVGAEQPGRWLSLVADLSAAAGGPLQPADLTACPAPDPQAVHRPDLGAAAQAALTS
jgi:hypothetical protein